MVHRHLLHELLLLYLLLGDNINGRSCSVYQVPTKDCADGVKGKLCIQVGIPVLLNESSQLLVGVVPQCD